MNALVRALFNSKRVANISCVREKKTWLDMSCTMMRPARLTRGIASAVFTADQRLASRNMTLSPSGGREPHHRSGTCQL